MSIDDNNMKTYFFIYNAFKDVWFLNKSIIRYYLSLFIKNIFNNMPYLYKKKNYITLLFCSLFITVGCNTTPLENAFKSFNIVIELPTINTSTGIMIQDAQTRELLSQPVTVRFVGHHADKVIDMYSDPISSVDVNGGILNIGLDNSVLPNEDQPVTLTMELLSDGYVSTTKQITFISIGQTSHAVSLMNRQTLPTGVVIQEANTGLAQSGQLIDSIFVSVKEIGSKEDISVSVTIPTGIRLKAEDGSLPSGSFQVNTLLYDAEEKMAVSEINPDLLMPYEDSILVMISAFDLEIRDNNGRLITDMESETSLKVANHGIKSSTSDESLFQTSQSISSSQSYILNFILNSATYTELRELLRLVYISPTTAERVIFYTVPQVTLLENGQVQLRYLLRDSIMRNAALVYFSEQPTNIQVSVDRNGNEGKIPVMLSEKGFTRTADLLADKSTLSFRNVTRGQKNLEFLLDFMVDGTYQNTIEVGDETMFQVILPAPPQSLIDAKLRVNLVCANPDQYVRVTNIPAASLFYRIKSAPSGTAWRVAANLTWEYNSETQSLTGGSAEIHSVEQGAIYDFKLTYDGNIEEASIEITGPQMEHTETIDADICR